MNALLEAGGYIIAGVALILLGRWFRRRAEILGARADKRERDINQFESDYHESALCCRSIVYVLGPDARCECFRCRHEREEPVNDRTQALAEAIQQAAMQRHLKAKTL